MSTEEYTKPVFIKKSASLIRHNKSKNVLSWYFFLNLGKLKMKFLCIHDITAKIRRRVAWFAF